MDAAPDEKQARRKLWRDASSSSQARVRRSRLRRSLVAQGRARASVVGHPEAPRIDLVALTGASNVTGEWPLERLAAIAHRHGARLFVDAAQLAPHRAIDMTDAGIDFLAFSGHKLYAPFGAGAVVGPVGALRLRCACADALARGHVAPDALVAHAVLGGAEPLGGPTQSWGSEPSEYPQRQERPGLRHLSSARAGDAERRLAQRERAEGRGAAGRVQPHPANPPHGLIRAVGGADQQDGGQHICLLARRAEHAVERLIPQMVEHGEGQPGVGEG
jgi:hypothetical protein